MKAQIVSMLVVFILVNCACFSQNSPLFIWGSGLNGSAMQTSGIYADTENGFLLDAPKDASGNKLNISFNWRGGGIPPLFIRGLDSNIGVGTSTPWDKLHINGSLGVGTWTSGAQSGLQIQYDDNNGNGTGTTVFKNSRWYSGFYFKRNGATGEKTQLYIGGGSDHVMEIYNDNSEAKIRFHTNGDSHLNGGNVGIGTTNTHGYKLAVAGNVVAEEVVVKLQTNWPDYVFEDGYKLPSLIELAKYLKQYKHLPEVPTASEVYENGVRLGEMNVILLKKVEELTLHIIEMDKRMKELEAKIVK